MSARSAARHRAPHRRCHRRRPGRRRARRGPPSPPGHHVVAASGASPSARTARIARLLPGTPDPPRRRGRPRRHRPAAARRPGRRARPAWSPAWPRPARCAPARSSRTPPARTGSPCSAGRDVGARPLALHPAMTFTGTAADLDRLPGISYGVTAPADLKAFADAAGRRPAAATPSGSPRTTARSTTPRSRTARTTWSRSSTRRSTGSRDAGVVYPEKVLGPLLHAALDNALRLRRRRADRSGLPGRRRHGRPAPRGDRGDRAGVRTRVPGAGPAHRGPGHRGRAAAPAGRRGAARMCWPATGRSGVA